jgi:hypothetical protein
VVIYDDRRQRMEGKELHCRSLNVIEKGIGSEERKKDGAKVKVREDIQPHAALTARTAQLCYCSSLDNRNELSPAPKRLVREW